MTIYGHDAQIAAFVAALTGERIHHGWLLTGPKGIGKASLARLMAVHVLAAASHAPPNGAGLSVAEDHATARLIAAGSHPDFRVLERATNEKTGALARNITIDQVRSLRAIFATTPSMGPARVVIVDAADDMERGAANALLKSLEEPPLGTIFLLVSHAPGRLLPTIRSRCRVLAFRPLGDAAMTSALAAAVPDDERRQALIKAARGIPADALAMAALDFGAIDATLAAIASDGDPTNARRSALASSLALKAAAPRYEAFLQRAPRLIAHRARQTTGAALERALDAWHAADTLARIAIPQSLVAETVVFEMAGHVAALAPADASAKA